MMLYEAESGGYLSQFDRIVAHIYRMSQQNNVNDDDVNEDDFIGGPSKSILDEDSDDEGDDENNDVNILKNGDRRNDEGSKINKTEEENLVLEKTGNDTAENDTKKDTIMQICSRIDVAIRLMEENDDNSKKKKKRSTTSDKVRQMLMKSRALGDKKGIKEDDRFYMEIVIVVDDCKSDDDVQTLSAPATKASSIAKMASFFSMFLSKKRSTISHISDFALTQLSSSAKNMQQNESEMDSEVLCKKTSDGVKDGFYYHLSNSMTLCEAEEKGCVAQFDRIIVRLFPKGNTLLSMAL